MDFDKHRWLSSNIHKKVSKSFLSEDSLFHYTSLKKGKLILKSQKLWSTSRKNSKDPVERLREQKSNKWFSDDDKSSKLIEDQTDDDVHEFYDRIDFRIHQGKQLSFCCNDVENGNLGFFKPRMMNQYGDDYKGVCFVFSKEQFLTENKELISLYDKVNYLEYYELQSLRFDINRNQLMKNREKYQESIFQKIDLKLFSKHSDYFGENEFRIVTHSSKEHDELSITNSLIGIICSSEIEKGDDWEYYKKYSQDNQIELKIIHWKSNKISIF